jgi:predicted nuclease with TOPRIM domain
MTTNLEPDEANFQQQVLDRLESLKRSDDQIREDVGQLKGEVERFNDRFISYQQATQWVVQLAFTLIASATITVIISAVFKR